MIDDRIWKLMGRRLGYNEKEAQAFRDEKRNAEVIAKAEELAKKRFKATVVHAHGCNSRHKEGDVFSLDGHGNLIGESNPARMCVFAVGALTTLVFTAQEMIYAGVDPNEMRFNRVQCTDVGVECGGWGKVIMELTAEERS